MVEQVTPVGTTFSVPPTRGQIPALTAGQVVDARVLAILDGGAVRLAIAGLTVEATTTAQLTPGSTVRLLAEEQGGALKLSVVDRVQTPATAVEARPAEAVATALSRALSNLVARQTSLAPLFADLEQVVGSAAAGGARAALPAGVLAAAAKVLDFRLAVSDAADPVQILTSFLRSGVFHDTVSPALPAAQGPLQRIGQALGQMVGGQGGQPAADLTAEQAAARTAAGGAQAPGLSLRSLLGLVALAEPKAGGPAAAQAQAGASLPLPDLKAALAELRNTLIGALGEDAARVAAMLPQRDDAARPPRRGTPPRAQPAVAPLLGGEAPAREALRTLLAETDGALARLSLAQLASSDAELAGAGRADKVAAPGWTFEVPLVTDGRTSIAQIEIRREETRNAAADGGQGWCVRFSIDVEPVGPVHAVLTLRGSDLSVSLWAERPATAERLQSEGAGFAALLSNQELTLERLFVRGGRPDAPPEPPRHLVNRVT